MKVSKSLYSDLDLPKASSEFIALIKLVIARYVRGNTAAQYASILLPSEQKAQRQEAEQAASLWETQFKSKSKAR